ncbi:MAG: hypothetical protein ACFFC7_18380 [Candidatus Hermodarchaeota archaeon]
MKKTQLIIVLCSILILVTIHSFIPVTASQQTIQVLEKTKATVSQSSGVDDFVIFSDAVCENMILKYNFTEFEIFTGLTTGSASIGYDPDHNFQGTALTVSQGDTLWVKVDTHLNSWENETGEHYLLYSSWDYGVSSWGPECNVSLIHDGTYFEVDEVFSRMMLFPIKQRLMYPPNDGRDHTATMLDVFGSHDDNGTIDPGSWSGSDNDLKSNVTYEWNSTYYMFYDCEAEFGYPENNLHLQYLKIPATFSKDDVTGHLLAHWNYSYYEMDYTLFTAGSYRWASWAYAHGYWPLLPFVNIVTDVETGISQSIEFYFGSDSAWKNTTLWDGEHPFSLQVTKLKLELMNITYAGPHISTQDDLTYEEGTTGHSLAWTVTDILPGSYSIYQNETEIASGDWTSGTVITQTVDGLVLGTYNYTVVVRDDAGYSTKNTAFVNVVDTTDPQIDSPSDVSYEQGSTGHSISWTAIDSHPATFTIYIDGTEDSSESWTSGIAIIINVDGLTVGIYNYTIFVTDTSGNSANDTVIVTVTSSSSTTTTTTTTSTTTSDTTTSTTTPGFGIFSLILSLLLLSLGVIFAKRWKNKH